MITLDIFNIVDTLVLYHQENIPITSYLKENVNFENYNSSKDFQVPTEAIKATGTINI